jgi:hypothetical protein
MLSKPSRVVCYIRITDYGLRLRVLYVYLQAIRGQILLIRKGIIRVQYIFCFYFSTCVV